MEDQLRKLAFQPAAAPALPPPPHPYERKRWSSPDGFLGLPSVLDSLPTLSTMLSTGHQQDAPPSASPSSIASHDTGDSTASPRSDCAALMASTAGGAASLASTRTHARAGSDSAYHFAHHHADVTHRGASSAHHPPLSGMSSPGDYQLNAANWFRPAAPAALPMAPAFAPAPPPPSRRSSEHAGSEQRVAPTRSAIPPSPFATCGLLPGGGSPAAAGVGGVGIIGSARAAAVPVGGVASASASRPSSPTLMAGFSLLAEEPSLDPNKPVYSRVLGRMI
ncbi:hypothetical protein FOA52_011548 [Chlamydomonas sp. UWO 241]|nr:hypothetical protein FOA52_011548 [Chlamydomonas sp. UWO 241]